MNRKKVAILYICTGRYSVFWDKFYVSFKKNFLVEEEISYFVFTDTKELPYEDNEDVHKFYLQQQPWPLPTLMRFYVFLSIKEELNLYDYIFFFNANMECKDVVTAKEFLPRDELGEKLVMTIHGGYYGKKNKEFPYERNKMSNAFIPRRKGKYYVSGAVNGGTSEAFLKLCHDIEMEIEDDLKRGVIAIWHDESHLNKYILDREDVRFLTPSYVYPWGMKVDYPCKIGAVDKLAYIDIDGMKKSNR